MSHSRIPHSKPLFFPYMADTDSYLLATPAGSTIPNWQRMNWLSAEQTEWHSFAADAANYALQWANKSKHMRDFGVRRFFHIGHAFG